MTPDPRREALARLEEFAKTLPSFFDVEAVAAAAPGPAVVAAAATLLRATYLSRTPGLDARAATALEVAALVLAAAGDGRALFSDVAMRVPHPDYLRSLAPLLTTAMRDDLVTPLLGAIDDDDPEVVLRALALCRAAFIGRGAARLTAGQAALLDTAVALRRDRARDPGLLETLAGWTCPAANGQR